MVFGFEFELHADALPAVKEILETSGIAENNNEDVPPIVPAEAMLMRTTLRQNLTHYLPPPVVNAIRQVDNQLETYIGPEPSVTIFSTFALALLLWNFLIRATDRGGGGKAIDDDDDQR